MAQTAPQKTDHLGLLPEDVAAMFTRSTGDYAFARWGRPLAPVVFGVDDATLRAFKSAIEVVVALAGQTTAETDPELGANVMIFVTRTWDELLDVPKLGALIPDLAPLVGRLNGALANQYRLFRFDAAGAIKAVFVFVRLDDHLAQMDAQDVALAQAAQLILLWSDRADTAQPMLAGRPGAAMLRAEIAGVIRAAYAAHLPAAATDPAHALRLWARL